MKIKSFIFFAVVLGMMMAFIGCSNTGSSPIQISISEDNPCDALPEGTNSTLCTIAKEKGVNLMDISKVLKLANTAALASNQYTATQAVAFIEKVIAGVKELQSKGSTYDELLAYAIAQHDGLDPKIKVAFVISSEMVNVKVSDPLYDFDYQLILLHLNKQLSIAKMFL